MFDARSGRSSRYFGLVVGLGVAMNIGAAIPGILVPGTILSFLGLGPEITEFWVRLACWLLILLSLTYVPVAIDPSASPAHSWITVGARWGGVFFVSATTLIVGLNPRYLIFALGDLIFAIPELILLALAFRVPMPKIAIFSITAATSIALLAGLGAYTAWYGLFRVAPGPYDRPGVPISEYFKYGSIGTEPAAGIPYWIWLVLPEIFPEYLPEPGGYPSLGMVWEVDQPTPIGITKQDIGIVPRAGLNCAVCHTSVYRKTTAETEPTVVLGGSSQGFDVLGYQRFLFEAAADPRFTADLILAEIGKAGGEFSWLESVLYRYLIIPGTKDALLENKEEWGWTYNNPEWGPGRIDPFNPVKFGLLGQPKDGTIGTSDMLSIWNMKIRDGMSLHWDGLNSSLREVVLSSTIGDGATAASLDLEVMGRIQEFLTEMPPPAFPFDIDDSLATAGQSVFNQQCSMCHTPGQGRTGQVIPINEIGTDRHRVDMWGAKDAAAYNEKYKDYEWGFTGFQDIDGYVAIPLDGVWLRAPYLHNGSVPSLKDLLAPPSIRPKNFYRGYDVYDPENVGFVSDVPQHDQTARPFFEFDTALPGNSNEGHLYGTELSAQDKNALIEYLKTQ